MRQLSITILFIFIFTVCTSSISYATSIKGGIKYTIPVNYSHLSESELSAKANNYYNIANVSSVNNEPDENMSKALLLYTILQNKNPKKELYSIRLGNLYDKLGKYKYAKSNLCRAIGINPYYSDGYYYLGEFYYKKGQYRSALREYIRAEKYLSGSNPDLYYKIGDIYEKFGDTRKALVYLKKVQPNSSNKNVNEKIKQLENADKTNQKFYTNN